MEQSINDEKEQSIDDALNDFFCDLDDMSSAQNSTQSGEASSANDSDGDGRGKDGTGTGGGFNGRGDLGL